jgi:hypothetical protein
VVESVRDVAIEKQHESSAAAAPGGERRAGWGGGMGKRFWAGTGLGAGPDLGEPAAAGHVELHEAVGEVDDRGGEDGTRSLEQGGKPVAGGEPERPAKRGVCAESGGLRETLGVERKGDGDNEMSMVFPNGSRLWGCRGARRQYGDFRR